MRSTMYSNIASNIRIFSSRILPGGIRLTNLKKYKIQIRSRRTFLRIYFQFLTRYCNKFHFYFSKAGNSYSRRFFLPRFVRISNVQRIPVNKTGRKFPSRWKILECSSRVATIRRYNRGDDCRASSGRVLSTFLPVARAFLIS